MSRRLGLGISAHAVRAVLIEEGEIAWAGVAEWNDESTLTDAIARLAAEAGRPVKIARVAIERDLVQLRTIVPAPPLSQRAAQRYVALEASRLFRKNGSVLVTDAAIVSIDNDTRALWAAAASETLLKAVLDGCAQAGLAVEGIGPAADVVRSAVQSTSQTSELVFPNGGTSELVAVGASGAWRSRRVTGVKDMTAPWHPGLARFESEAAHFAPAFAVALTLPRLQLLPADTRAARAHGMRRRLTRMTALAALLWVMAGGVYATRLSLMASRARRELAGSGAAIDSAIALRRELDAARSTLAQFASAEQSRSRFLALLGEFSRVIGDSAYLVALRIDASGAVHLVGYAPSAPRVLANLERAPALRAPHMEGGVTREVVAGRGELDRFAIVAESTGP